MPDVERLMARLIPTSRSRAATFAPWVLGLAACGDDATVFQAAPAQNSYDGSQQLPGADAGVDCGAAGSCPAPEPGSPGAVMVSVSLLTGDESTLYVGAYSGLPQGDLDTSGMIEVGANSRAATFNGFVYVWNGESGRYTRYSVDDSLALAAGPVVSFAGLGVTGQVMTSFVSP